MFHKIFSDTSGMLKQIVNIKIYKNNVNSYLKKKNTF